MKSVKEELIKVELIADKEDCIELKCTVVKTIFMEMFGSWEFQKGVENAIAQRLINEMPLEILNQLRSKIDLEVVAKLATVETAKGLMEMRRRE